MVPEVGRGDLTHAEWARLAPLLPGGGLPGGRWSGHRTVINGILFHLRTGVPWRDVPSQYGPWKTVYEHHRRWSADGTWDKILRSLLAHADAEDRIDWSMVGIDSTSCRAHQPRGRRTHNSPSHPRTAGRPCSASARGGTGTFAGRSDKQDSSDRRGRTPPLGVPDHPGTGGRRSTAHPGAGTSERPPTHHRPTPARAPTISAGTRRTAPAATADTSADARLSTPLPNRAANGPTGNGADAGAADPSASTR